MSFNDYIFETTYRYVKEEYGDVDGVDFHELHEELVEKFMENIEQPISDGTYDALGEIPGVIERGW